MNDDSYASQDKCQNNDFTPLIAIPMVAIIIMIMCCSSAPVRNGHAYSGDVNNTRRNVFSDMYSYAPKRDACINDDLKKESCQKETTTTTTIPSTDVYVPMQQANNLLIDKVCHDENAGGHGHEHEPISRVYVGSYKEGYTTFENHVNLVFTPMDKQGCRFWKITGQGKDADGTFEIVEGWRSASGKAFWIERQQGRSVLNEGTFDNSNNFQGRWHASNGVRCPDYSLHLVVNDGRLV